MEYIMRMKRPASWHNENWREGTPIGNGLHGALIYGNTAQEKIMLTHTRLWREGKACDIPDVSDTLPKMRELIFKGQVPEADRMLVDALQEKGYNPHEAYPFPAADIHIALKAVKGFSKYTRNLNMSTAQAEVSYVDDEVITRKSFVSRADDIVVIQCHKDSKIDITVHMPDLINQQNIILPKEAKTITDGEWIYFKATIGEVEHGVVARVLRGEHTLILARIYTSGTSHTQWEVLKQSIEALPADYDILFARHLPIHQALFGSCEFTLEDTHANDSMTNEELLDIAYDDGLPNTLTKRMWAYGRYLLISGTQEGGLPCNLTGLWSGEYRAFWAFNMANINLEMTYWQALSAGLTSLMLPFFDYYDNAIDDFKENARKIYGCDGIFVPAVTMPTGTKHVCMAPHITNWTAGAGWISQHYYDYYIYTKDADFLANRALPFMRETAKFYIDFVVWQGDKWHVCPSVSPENHTTSYKGTAQNLGDPNATSDLGDGTQSSIDATMDIAVIKELFMHLVAIGESTNLIPKDEYDTYKKMIQGAILYQTNEYNAPREWLHEHFEDNDYHRHQSHLYPMFPGLELARQSEQTDKQYHTGAKRRMTVGISFQTSWSLIQNANTMARVKDGELALESLNLISKSCIQRNLFTTHNDWRGSGIGLTLPMAPYQIDANTGWPSAVQEMLLFSNEDRVDILPALPKQWNKGKIGTLYTRCGVSVIITWDTQNSSHVHIKAERDMGMDKECTLYLPNGENKPLKLKQGECVEYVFKFLN